MSLWSAIKAAFNDQPWSTQSYGDTQDHLAVQEKDIRAKVQRRQAEGTITDEQANDYLRAAGADLENPYVGANAAYWESMEDSITDPASTVKRAAGYVGDVGAATVDTAGQAAGEAVKKLFGGLGVAGWAVVILGVGALFLYFGGAQLIRKNIA